MKQADLETPIGTLRFAIDGEVVISADFLKGEEPSEEDQHPLLEECKFQMGAYFKGRLKEFDLPLDLRGTEFQKKVWGQLLQIPYGTTSTYLSLSRELGDVKAIRAVASANGRNPLAIIVPCHRVIGSDGSLTGYAGGLWRKKRLLELEAEVSNSVRQTSLFD